MEPTTVAFEIAGRLDRRDIPSLCDRARVLLEGVAADRLVCDVGAVQLPDAVTVDALARLQLTARRLGREVRLEHVSPGLRELLELMGLSDVVPPAGSGLEMRRQTEEREELGGVQEEADPADPPA